MEFSVVHTSQADADRLAVGWVIASFNSQLHGFVCAFSATTTSLQATEGDRLQCCALHARQVSLVCQYSQVQHMVHRQHSWRENLPDSEARARTCEERQPDRGQAAPTTIDIFGKDVEQPCLLNGSVGSDRRWRRMVARSTVEPLGSFTGSSMMVDMMGSQKSSGASSSFASAACTAPAARLRPGITQSRVVILVWHMC